MLFIDNIKVGLLPAILAYFVTELWPLIDVKILFLLNVVKLSCSIYLEIGLFTA